MQSTSVAIWFQVVVAFAYQRVSMFLRKPSFLLLLARNHTKMTGNWQENLQKEIQFSFM